MVMLDDRPRFFDERRIAHAGRARRFARHASEAGIEVLDERLSNANAALGPRLHQVDAPARGIHFPSEEQITGTGRQTEAAMHAFVHQRRQGRERLESGFRCVQLKVSRLKKAINCQLSAETRESS